MRGTRLLHLPNGWHSPDSTTISTSSPPLPFTPIKQPRAWLLTPPLWFFLKHYFHLVSSFWLLPHHPQQSHPRLLALALPRRTCSSLERCPPYRHASLWRGQSVVIIMTDFPNFPPNLAPTTLACPTCVNRYSNKKALLHHLRTSSDEQHKTLRYDA